MIGKQFLTISDLTHRYQVSKRTIYRWMKLEINAFPYPKINQVGTTCLWDPEEVEAWESRANKTAQCQSEI